MRILFAHPACDFSVSDVARGYRAAFERQGHDLRDYEVGKRMHYHARAMGDRFREHVEAVSKQASETLVVEALYHQADLVVLVSALIYHPAAIALLRRAHIPLVVLHTESPYEDGQQAEWASAYPEALHCTHERTSAERLGWFYLPHAYDPAIHRPDGEAVDACDVLFVGTGWPERIAFFEAVDWTGIDVRLMGLWPALSDDSPLRRFYREGMVPNDQAVSRYRAARINLNLHRADQSAVSLNPRGYELAACGAFTLSDERADGLALFGETVPTFRTPSDLTALIRYYLTVPDERQRLAEQARTRVEPETFDARAAALMAAWTMHHPAAEAAHRGV